MGTCRVAILEAILIHLHLNTALSLVQALLPAIIAAEVRANPRLRDTFRWECLVKLFPSLRLSLPKSSIAPHGQLHFEPTCLNHRSVILKKTPQSRHGAVDGSNTSLR